MRTYIAITTLITMLAASAAFAQDWAAPPKGIGEIAAYGYPANDQIQATLAAQYRIDPTTLSPMQTSGTPSAPVAFIAARGGGSMHGGMGSFHGGSMHGGMGSFHGGSMHGGMGSFHGGSMHGDFHRDFDRSFHRDFDRSFHRDFNRGFHRDFNRSFHRDFDFHRHNDFRWGLGFGYYPYGGPYYYPYGPYYYPYGYYYYGNPWYFYTYPYFYFVW